MADVLDVEQAILDAKHLLGIADPNSANNMTNRTLKVLSEYAEKQDWQDISTAPKDGTAILLFDGDNQYVARWEHPLASFVWVYAHVRTPHNIYYEQVYKPTHWQKLPESPK